MRETSFKERVDEMNRRREGLSVEMDQVAQERAKIEKMRDHLDKRKQVIGEQVDSIAEITRKLEEMRARTKRRTDEAQTPPPADEKSK
jgi:hypothetical protein